MAMQRELHLLATAAEPAGPALQVAFATSDLKHVDQHFGSAERFAIYRVDAEGHALLRVAEFGRLDQDGNENKLLEKFVLVAGCAAVYCLAVGPSAVRQLLELDIQPLKVAEGTPVNALLGVLQQQIATAPGGWMARALRRNRRDEGRFDAMAEEGWQE